MLKKLFRWQVGRQLSGYDKMLLWIVPLPFVWLDGYLLRFRKGSKILPHTDKVNSYKHYRLNIVLKSALSGGEFVCGQSYINTKRFKFFRSDMMEHQVLEVTKGSRYVLSLGFAFKKTKNS